MRRRTITPRHSSGEINVTPLIDVVMCLIIFYLMVGKLATDRKSPVKLPESAIGAAADPEVLIVNVLAGRAGHTPGVAGAAWPDATAGAAQVIVDGAPLAGPTMLENLVRERLLRNPALIVQIRAEQSFEYRIVAPVMKACTQGGATSVRLATERAAVIPPAREPNP
ncbi:MAG: biopolymer transporter ExbD [Pyrinomonadaceae bacterium]|nr:biopolymer transporter ExbD [Phycisphaerales bacterium]